VKRMSHPIRFWWRMAVNIVIFCSLGRGGSSVWMIGIWIWRVRASLYAKTLERQTGVSMRFRLWRKMLSRSWRFDTAIGCWHIRKCSGVSVVAWHLGHMIVSLLNEFYQASIGWDCVVSRGNLTKFENLECQWRWDPCVLLVYLIIICLIPYSVHISLHLPYWSTCSRPFKYSKNRIQISCVSSVVVQNTESFHTRKTLYFWRHWQIFHQMR